MPTQSFVLCDVMLIDLPFIAFYIYYDYVKRNDELPAAACKLDMDMDTGNLVRLPWRRRTQPASTTSRLTAIAVAVVVGVGVVD